MHWGVMRSKTGLFVSCQEVSFCCHPNPAPIGTVPSWVRLSSRLPLCRCCAIGADRWNAECFLLVLPRPTPGRHGRLSFLRHTLQFVELPLLLPRRSPPGSVRCGDGALFCFALRGPSAAIISWPLSADASAAFSSARLVTSVRLPCGLASCLSS